MASFKESIVNTPDLSVTANGALAYSTSMSHCVDLFFAIGASRGQSISKSLLKNALIENRGIAARILLWARDIRGGAGERQTFRNILPKIAEFDVNLFKQVVKRIPEVGRWDDLLMAEDNLRREYCYPIIKQGLEDGNSLCAKWMPRKGLIAVELRNYLSMTPKQYRKTLVELTKVVETQMCANKWDEIEYGKVPSIASKNYQAAFGKHSPDLYSAYLDGLAKGTEKVNAGAIFPHDVIKPLLGMRYSTISSDNLKFIEAQWEALPNFLGESSILPMVDVSGSMSCAAGEGITCMQVAIGLGLYIADKQTGPFSDVFMTFSSMPKLQVLNGTIAQKVSQLQSAEWGMTTNLNAAMHNLLEFSVRNRVKPKEMPKFIFIFSDMQFDSAMDRGDEVLFDHFKHTYNIYGYELPNIVYWNIRHVAKTVPVTINDKGVALVSGYSPSVCKSILQAKGVTPIDVMLEAVMNPRYNLEGDL